jgi:hypothetical protein
VRTFAKALGVLAALLVATSAGAQAEPPTAAAPPAGSTPLSLGRVQVYPSIIIQDVGVDSNVYNRPDGREDFTYTVAPKLMGAMQIGGASLTTNGGLGFTYFQRTKDQQAVNSDASGLIQVRSGRVRPAAEVAFARRRQRSGDIDIRALSVATSGRAGLDVGISGVTSFTGWVSRSRLVYEQGASFAGVDLAEQLSRTSTTVASGLRFDVTPLTSLVVAAEVERTTFDDALLRDYRGYRVAPTVRFGEGAIMQGRVSAGFRDFRPESSLLPRYRGVVASADVHFAVHGTTRFDVSAARDVVTSFDELQPYYLDSTSALRVTQRIGGPFEAIALGEVRRFGYLARLDAGVPARVERIRTFGGGIGIRLDDSMRFTVTVDRQRRTNSLDAWRNYERSRVLASVEYLP